MASDSDIKQAIAAVARVGGFSIKRIATSDDLKERTLTITIIRPSDGWQQDRFDFEDVTADQIATIDGRNGHVEDVETLPGLQAGDLAETGAEADAEVAAAAAVLPEAPGGAEPDEPKPEFHPVGEVAAITRRRKRVGG